MSCRNLSGTIDLMPKPPRSSITDLLRQVLLEHKGQMNSAYYEDAYYRLLWASYRTEIDNRLLIERLMALGETELPVQILATRKIVLSSID